VTRGPKRPLIVDTDGGIDDALSLLMLVAAGRVPDLVTVCFGNVDLQTASRNVRAVLGLHGVQVPVHEGATRPLVSERVDATDAHGYDGLGGAPIPSPAYPAASRDAVYALRSYLNSLEEGAGAELLALGPLTNVALALRLEPEISERIGRVVVMGGACRGRGNTTPAAEFNVFADPEAASIVLSSGLPLTLVPWEVCVDCAILGNAVENLLKEALPGPVRDFVAATTAYGRRRRVRTWGRDELVLPDPLATSILLNADVVKEENEADVGVELGGLFARGATLVDFDFPEGASTVRVVEAADTDGLQALLAGVLACETLLQQGEPRELAEPTHVTRNPYRKESRKHE
jgi:purine nucleosidase/non-specific riboncleoside hydrolase